MSLMHNIDNPSTSQDIHWVGSTNELNASYAADVSSLVECAFDLFSLLCMLKTHDRLG
jgi:hypothetical protein